MKNDKNKKSEEQICHRNSCDEKNNLKKCKHCEQLFCKYHIKPYPPYFGLDQRDERHQGDGGHPCIPYASYLEKEEKKKEEKYRKDLDLLLKRKTHTFTSTKNHQKNKQLEPFRGETLYIDEDEDENYQKNNFKKQNKKKKSNKKKRKKIFKIIMIFFIIILLIFIIINTNIINLITNYYHINEENSILDEKTTKAFSYINEYRNKNNVQNLIYAEEIYPYIKDATKSKDLSPDSFKNYAEFENLIKYYFNISSITKSYYTTYFIGGGGIEKFYTEFDKNYGARSIIKNTEYNQGAIYCELDYCILFVFYSNMEINSNLETPTPSNKISYISSQINNNKYSKYQTNPKTITLPQIGNMIVYQGLNDHLSEEERSISYYYIPPTTKDFVLKNIDNPIQKIFLEEVVQKIKEKSSSSEQQAKIAILMVQGIPYDDYAAESNNIDARYAYEVLYDMKGVCMEKSDLLAYLLRELGFGVAIFEFENEEHRAVGIKCNDGNYNSQYCFIESTDYFPIGKIPTDYVGNVNIKNANPEIIIISDGKTFEN